jgi:hypothetical protein
VRRAGGALGRHLRSAIAPPNLPTLTREASSSTRTTPATAP